MSGKEKKRPAIVILRPQPTARSRSRSRGVHLVGALYVPPLVQVPLDMVRPDRVEELRNKTFLSRPPPNHTFDGGLRDYTQWVHSACPH